MSALLSKCVPVTSGCLYYDEEVGMKYCTSQISSDNIGIETSIFGVIECPRVCTQTLWANKNYTVIQPGMHLTQ